MNDEHTNTDTELGVDPAFKRLPPRIMPEQMVETQAVTRPDHSVHSDTETEWQIRMGGGG